MLIDLCPGKIIGVTAMHKDVKVVIKLEKVITRLGFGIPLILEGMASKAVAYAVLGKRRIPEAADAVIAGAKAGNAAAQKVLANVATDKNFDALCEIYEAGKGSDLAINKAIQDKPAAEQVAAVNARMAKAGDKKHLYYPVLARTGSDDVIPVLVAGYKEGNKDGMAFGSMLSLNSDKMIESLYEVATSR